MAEKYQGSAGSAVVALGLALGGSWTAQAQGVSPSTGSGLGTGAGAGAMSTANTGAGAGAMSSANPLSGSGAMTARGPGSPMAGGTALPLGPRRGTVPFGPGVDVSFPNDPYLVPFLLPIEAANPLETKAPDKIHSSLLNEARAIVDPAERSLALRQIANGAMADNQMMLAHRILEESIRATSEVNVPLVRDQRLIGLVVSLNRLADTLLRVGRENQGRIATPDEAATAGLEALPKHPETTVLIRLARLEWRRAVYLARLISNPTYSNEMLYEIAESEAIGSSSIANDFLASEEIESLGNRRGAGGNNAPPPPRPYPPTTTNPPSRPDRGPVPAQAPAPLGGRAPSDLARGAIELPPVPPDDKQAGNFTKIADELLLDAWNVANEIERLIWKNRAMVRIALSASDSRQFSRGVEMARTIDNAESRSEALLLLAEAMCRPEHSHPAQATAAFQDAAEAVASIPQAGLRGVMTGFLIDSLIAAGRFEDARSCTVIYPEESDRFVALGAIAEAQGRRGLAEAARKWIAAEAPSAYRSALYRRVASGVLRSVESQRTEEKEFGGDGR